MLYSYLTDTMNDIELMAQNLSRLMKEDASLSSIQQNQPADPFQKRPFGKKLRKSKSISQTSGKSFLIPNSIRPVTLEELYNLPKISKSTKNQHQKSKSSMYDTFDSPELQVYFTQIERSINRLKIALPSIQRQYKQRIKQFYLISSQSQLQSQTDQLICELQGSIEFVINDCLTVKKPQRYHQSLYDQKENRSNHINIVEKLSKPTKEFKSQRNSKSVYETILQSRRMKKANKRII